MFRNRRQTPFEELTALLGRLGTSPRKRNGEKTQNVGEKRKEKRERGVTQLDLRTKGDR